MEQPTNYQSLVTDFLASGGLDRVVAFSGGYVDNEEQAKNIIEQSMRVYQQYPVAILTGGTSWNLPGQATVIAKDYGLPVIGVLPETGKKYISPHLDLSLVIPSLYGRSEWGDESQLFAKIADGIELIGGGPGAGVELFQAMKISLDRLSDKERPIFIAPVAGFGGIESTIYSSPFVNTNIMPQEPFTDGTMAAQYLMNRLYE